MLAVHGRSWVCFHHLKYVHIQFLCVGLTRSKTQSVLQLHVTMGIQSHVHLSPIDSSLHSVCCFVGDIGFGGWVEVDCFRMWMTMRTA